MVGPGIGVGRVGVWRAGVEMEGTDVPVVEYGAFVVSGTGVVSATAHSVIPVSYGRFLAAGTARIMLALTAPLGTGSGQVCFDSHTSSVTGFGDAPEVGCLGQEPSPMVDGGSMVSVDSGREADC